MDVDLYNKFKQNKSLSIEELDYVKSIRVVQNSVIYAIGIKQDFCNEEILKSVKWFGQYGTIDSIRINKNNVFTVKKDKKRYCRAYITYKNPLSSSLAILSINLVSTKGLGK